MGPDLIPDLLRVASELLHALPGVSELSDAILHFDATDAGPVLPGVAAGGGAGAAGAGSGAGGDGGDGDPPPDDPPPEDDCEQ